jgi:hypothetical protein
MYLYKHTEMLNFTIQLKFFIELLNLNVRIYFGKTKTRNRHVTNFLVEANEKTE